MDPTLWLLCAYIDAARGDVSEADAELERGLAEIDYAGGLQSVAPNLTEAARVHQLLGRTEPAVELVDRTLDLLGEAKLRSPGPRADNLLAFYLAGRGDRWLEIADARFAETGRVWVGRLICSGRLVEAAELLGQVASPHEEAVTRLAAAEHLLALGRRADAGAQLDVALPYFERAGAGRIIAQAESLFAAAS
jgi:tetratricopeptide (TPR) repeat protein